MKNTRKTCTKKELKILGDFWTLEIIQALSQGPLRFCQIERTIDGANPATLTNRLKKLEDHKLISRQTKTIDKNSVEYTLTKKGEGILPILREISIFAEKHL